MSNKRNNRFYKIKKKKKLKNNCRNKNKMRRRNDMRACGFVKCRGDGLTCKNRHKRASVSV